MLTVMRKKISLNKNVMSSKMCDFTQRSFYKTASYYAACKTVTILILMRIAVVQGSHSRLPQ